MRKLSKEQINRLYDEFEFRDNEEIIGASYFILPSSGRIELVITLYDGDVSWDYLPNMEDTPEDRARLNYILTGDKNSPTVKGWDVYGHPYEYDEVKVIAMLYSAVTRKRLPFDWEGIARVGHYVWRDYCDHLQKRFNHEPDDSYEAVRDREEEGYVQAWLYDKLDYFIEKYKNNLEW